MDLVVITPCRDEAAFAQRTLDSMDRQTRRPDLWVIVNDGSTDATGEMVERFASSRPWIKVVHRQNRGHRAVGPGVIDAFYAGFEQISGRAWDFVCKLDLDLDLPERYFELLLARMMSDPRLGTCSGKPYFRDQRSGRLISEGCGDENSVGASKLYRRICFEQIGGFIRDVSWDGIDGHRCRMFGWRARSWDEPELRFEHLRPMGSSQQSIWVGRKRAGWGQYFMGTAPWYMAAVAAFRMTRPPLVTGGLGLAVGYLSGYVRRDRRYGDAEFRRFLRWWQWMVLTRGRSRALLQIEAATAARWHADRPNG